MKEEKELNLVEILKNAPEGTKLYSPIFGECELKEVRENGEIIVRADITGYYTFYEKGNYFKNCGECLLFPSKENRDWSTFKAGKEGFQVGDHVKEKIKKQDTFVKNSPENERIKGVIVSSERKFRELIYWLRSQGAVESSLVTLVTVVRSAIYYVNKQGQVMYTDKIHADLFDIVELPEWRALKGERYYYISDRGHVSPAIEADGVNDNCRYEIGNYFETFKEAKPYAKKICKIFKAKSKRI